MARALGQGQRRFPRISEEHAVLVRKLAPGLPEGLYKTSGLGLGGCEFFAGTPFGVGSRLDVMISLERRVIRAEGRVVYERRLGKSDFGVGVQFGRLDSRTREMLESLFELEGFRCAPECEIPGAAAGAVA